MRIFWVDNAKAIAIFLVVLGHTKGIIGTPLHLIFSFHMPLFFFLSGFLLKEKYVTEAFWSFTLRNIKRLLIPYASFWVISYLIWFPTQSLRTDFQKFAKLSAFDPFCGLLYGIKETLYVNPVLWFFTCLFCTATIFYWVSKLRDKKVIVLILTFFGLLGPLIHYYIKIRLPWNFELSFVVIAFYGAGHVVSTSEIFRAPYFSKLRIFAFVALCGILFLPVKYNSFVDMSGIQFGNLFLFYLGAFSGIGITILLSQIIPENMFFEWLSRNTIVIFALHKLIFNVFTGTGVVLFGKAISFRESFLFCILYTIGAFAVCYPISYMLNNYFPWIIGRRNTSQGKSAIPVVINRNTIK